MTVHHDDHHHHHGAEESPWVVTLPLLLLAIPSLVIGFFMVDWILHPQMSMSGETLLGSSVFVLPSHPAVEIITHHFKGAWEMALHSLSSTTLYLTLLGILLAYVFNLSNPEWSTWLRQRFFWVSFVLIKKYGFDDFNERVLVRGVRGLGHVLYKIADVRLIDGAIVSGGARMVQWFARTSRASQTGYVYQYAFVMVMAIIFLLVLFVWGF